MDDGRLGDGMTLEGIARQLAVIGSDVNALKMDVGVLKTDVGALKTDVGELKADVGALKTDVSGMKGDLKALDGKVDRLDGRMKIEFEDTRSLVKMGFESVVMLDEKIDRRFDETERAHADHRMVLEAAIMRLRRDALPPKGPALRRRRPPPRRRR